MFIGLNFVYAFVVIVVSPVKKELNLERLSCDRGSYTCNEKTKI